MNEQGSLLDVNFDDVYDFELIPDGTEVELRISTAEIALSKSQNPMLHVKLSDPTNPKVDDIHHYIILPIADADMDPTVINKRKMRLRDFYVCFDVDTNHPVDVSRDLPGQTGICIVGVDPSDMGDRNIVKSFVKGV